jgi:curved DNA-binding protein
MALTINQAAEILGVEPSIRGIDLKRVWRKLARNCHPDRFPNDKEKEKEFKKLAEAYETLNAFDDLARTTHEMDSEILDDDFRFMLNKLPKNERQQILDKLRELESERD